MKDMKNLITITISSKTGSVEQRVHKGTTLLTALTEAGQKVPTLCHHKDLTPNGSCRLCLTEIAEGAGKKRLVTACNYPLRKDAEAWTDSEPVLQHRKVLAEMYLGRWPEVPIIQEIAEECGVTENRFTGPWTDTNPKACILCTHCVRACAEFPMENILDFAGRGITRHLTMPFGEVDPTCVGCTSCAYVCPTGAIQITDDANKPFDPIRLRDHGLKVAAEMATLDDSQCRMRQVGTANIVEVMDAYDLLPVHNYKFGAHEDTHKIASNVFRDSFWTQGISDACWWGCSMACAKAADKFELRTGPYKGDRVTIDGPEYETAAGGSNMGCFDPAFILEFNFYCDTYGVDTISVATCVAFVMEAFEAGIIDETVTGGLTLRFGAADEVFVLLHQMALGEGFGVEVGQGVRYLKEKWIREGREKPGNTGFLQDIGMEVKGLEYSEYVSKESLAQQGGYAMTNKGPQHDEAWLIFIDMVNNQIPSFDDKAEALYYFPLWRTWFGLWGLCKLVWNDVVPSDNYLEDEPAKVPDHVRNYLAVVEAMTGMDDMTDAKMLDQSAKVYNLQRLMSLMFDKASAAHDMPPYRAVGPVTVEEYESRAERYDGQLTELFEASKGTEISKKASFDPSGQTTQAKMAALRAHREEQYRVLQTAVYKRRGWDTDGVPTRARLEELGIAIPEVLNLLPEDNSANGSNGGNSDNGNVQGHT
jgi:aldehyde:ferredoxin oxidoreductase/Pyruvate/2-oxoacid:ferredoxin oxidoreductase delta subunit/ferredoxin